MRRSRPTRLRAYTAWWASSDGRWAPSCRASRRAPSSCGDVRAMYRAACRVGRRQVLLGLGGLVLAGVAPPARVAQGSPPADGEGNMGTVTVHVQYVVRGGARRPAAPDAAGRPMPAEPAAFPAEGVVVEAVPAGDGTVVPSASAVTD